MSAFAYQARRARLPNGCLGYKILVCVGREYLLVTWETHAILSGEELLEQAREIAQKLRLRRRHRDN